MTVVRARFGVWMPRVLFVGAVAIGLLVGTVAPLGALGMSALPARASPGVPMPSLRSSSALLDPAFATVVSEVGSVPNSSVVGVGVAVVWQALDSGGARVPTFAVGCELAVIERSNGSAVRAWVNASGFGAVTRSANGTFSIPAAAWSSGLLSLTVSVASAGSAALRLFGPALPAVPPTISLSVLPDLDHLTLYGHDTTTLSLENRTNHTFWHVRDRFGDPTPGASLILTISTAFAQSGAFIPVNWSTGATTGAWVNYSVMGSGNATVRITDLSNTTLLGPIVLPALATPASAPIASLSLLEIVAVGILAASAVLGMVALSARGRKPASSGSGEGEEELQRLAEGRETIVDLVRKAGSLGLADIEAAWEPASAPPALADWVASLVTDGTLTAILGEGGRARFALAERTHEEPRVTLDEDALEREIARRDAAVDGEDDETR